MKKEIPIEAGVFTENYTKVIDEVVKIAKEEKIIDTQKCELICKEAIDLILDKLKDEEDCVNHTEIFYTALKIFAVLTHGVNEGAREWEKRGRPSDLL